MAGTERQAGTTHTAAPADGFEWRQVRATDGLRLAVRLYGAADAPGLPVICLPGLSRNSDDFHELALALAARGRFVVCPDLRGRGASDHDPDPANYTVVTEADDVLAIAAALGIGRAAIVGTSRGGLIAAVLSAMRPTLLAAVVLNDIGPVVDMRGLVRIRDMLRAATQPATIEEAARALRDGPGRDFPALGEADWMRQARAIYEETPEGGLRRRHDPALTATVATVDPATPPPSLWPQFMGLSAIPVLVLRGANSDILSRHTLAEMEERMPMLRALTVPGQGHAPDLAVPQVGAAVIDFLDEVVPLPSNDA